MVAPDKLRIPLDEHRFKTVGWLPDGTQFMAFITGAMPRAFERGELWDSECRTVDDYYPKYKAWYAILHTFDADGNHLKTESRLGRMDSETGEEAYAKPAAQLDELLKQIRRQRPKLCDIYVRPFEVEVDGVRHALVYETIQPEEGLR